MKLKERILKDIGACTTGLVLAALLVAGHEVSTMRSRVHDVLSDSPPDTERALREVDQTSSFVRQLLLAAGIAFLVNFTCSALREDKRTRKSTQNKQQ
jgi:hypothetical protein